MVIEFQYCTYIHTCVCLPIYIHTITILPNCASFQRAVKYSTLLLSQAKQCFIPFCEGWPSLKDKLHDEHTGHNAASRCSSPMAICLPACMHTTHTYSYMFAYTYVCIHRHIYIYFCMYT